MSTPCPKRSRYGMPGWVPLETYLSIAETLALGELDLWAYHSRCSYCNNPPDWRGLERAHIVRKGVGGKRKGTTGPTVRMCAICHTSMDSRSMQTLAIRRDGAVCFLTWDGYRVHERVLDIPPVDAIQSVSEVNE